MIIQTGLFHIMPPILRPISITDLEAYRKEIAPDRAYHRLNGPYFGLPTNKDQDEKIEAIRQALTTGETSPFQIIANENKVSILGEVSYYWKDKRTDWLEVGILIFDERNWGKGIGAHILPLWISHILRERPNLPRIGLTTWSGNPGMMKLASRIGLKQEACYHKARIFEGQHYDSVSYGILRENWFERHSNPS